MLRKCSYSEEVLSNTVTRADGMCYGTALIFVDCGDEYTSSGSFIFIHYLQLGYLTTFCQLCKHYSDDWSNFEQRIL